MTRLLHSLLFVATLLSVAVQAASDRPAATVATPLAIGETYTIESRALGETRRINVYLPAGYAAAPGAAFPVLYMPDGGIGEDFLHVAGLVQVSIGNGTMRPVLLVGIENTERRRDLTGPTEIAADREIAPRVGGSAAFRQFLREELMPDVRARYRTTDETAIVGESLAGLFVLETFFVEPALFDTCIAIDPSVWWNGGALVRDAEARLRERDNAGLTLWLASSDEAGIATPVAALADTLRRVDAAGLRWSHLPMPGERHATIYHPAALQAFRNVFKPQPAAAAP